MKPFQKQSDAMRAYIWRTMDWTKSNAQIAKELKCTKGAVTINRHRHAPEHLKDGHAVHVMFRKGLSPATKSKWAGVDWKLSDEVLARRHRCSLTTLDLRRKKFAPGTVIRKKCGGSYKHLVPLPDVIDWSQSNTALALILQRSYSLVGRLRREQAPHTLQSKGPRPKTMRAKVKITTIEVTGTNDEVQTVIKKLTPVVPPKTRPLKPSNFDSE